MMSARHGGPGGARTLDPRIKSPMLYRLSYRPDRNSLLARIRELRQSSNATAGVRPGTGGRAALPPGSGHSPMTGV